MSSNESPHDIFLSHASADKPWVRTLVDELLRLGLRVFLDEKDIQPADNFVLEISKALGESRYCVLVLSQHSVERPWVIQEWTSYMAHHGPLGRIIPLRIDDVEAPTILAAMQHLDARDRDALRAAQKLAYLVGRPQDMDEIDLRHANLGRQTAFQL